MGHISRRGSDSPLHVKSKLLSVDVINVVKQNNDWRINSLFQQFLRSGTSIHANIRESEFAQSGADFISKLSIALKEANETQGWVEVLFASQCIQKSVFENLYSKVDELIAMLAASIKTAKINYNNIK